LNILITGSSGFIGRNLVEGLSDIGSIIGLDRKSFEFSTDVKQYKGDTNSWETFSQIKEKVDVVLHFGSASSTLNFKENPGNLFTSEVKSFFNALEFAIKNGSKIFIYPSSASVYRTDRSSSIKVVDPPNFYGLLKITEENICRLYSDRIKTIGLRIFMVYGPGEESKGERASPISLFVQDIIKRKRPLIFGDGTQTRDPIYIRDLIDIIRNIIILHNTLHDAVYDICTGHQISFNEIIKVIKEITKINDVNPEYIERPKSYIEASIGDPSFAKNMLNRDFITIRDGIKQIIEQSGINKSELKV
jgi:UDP-glucose 4-epimerase